MFTYQNHYCLMSEQTNLLLDQTTKQSISTDCLMVLFNDNCTNVWSFVESFISKAFLFDHLFILCFDSMLLIMLFYVLFCLDYFKDIFTFVDFWFALLKVVWFCFFSRKTTYCLFLLPKNRCLILFDFLQKHDCLIILRKKVVWFCLISCKTNDCLIFCRK